MSWEEYKKKREQQSSWEQYKQKREKQLQENKTSTSNAQSISSKNSSNNKTSLWDNIQNLASGTGKVADNLWQGLKNGVMSLQQTVGRAANNTQADSMDLINKMNKRALEGKLKDDPEEAEQINKVINNPLISGDKIREESEEYYNKIQEKKNENTLKIQQNAESMNTEVGKYIAGEIAPGIGQMLPGMVGGTIGTTYFIGSATGNYYDDAKQRGMTEDQATKYSGVMGIIEGSLESIGAKLTTNVGKQLLKKNIKGALVNYGLDIGENFLEESIVEPLSELVATTTAGKDKADWSNMGQRMWESGVAGAITSAITGGVSGTIGTVGSKVTQQNKYVDYNTNKKLDKDSQNILKQAENIIQENNTTDLLPQLTQNEQNTPSQQVMPMQQEKAQNTISEQVKIDSANFAKQVDSVKNGTFPQNDMLTLGNTPQVLKDIGLPDLPITMTQKHLNTIMNKTGKYAGANYHDLGIDIVKQLPEAINNPLDIVKSNTKSDSIVLTTYLADKQNRTVIASIKMNGKGTINDIRIDTNVMTSAYGRNNYEKFMEENIKNGNLLYDIDRGVLKKVTGERLQLPIRSNSSTEARLQLPRNDASITNSIPQNTKNVNGNTTTNYSMQETENNSVFFNLPQNTSNMQAQEEISANWPISEDTKARKHYKSIMESQYASDEAKMIAKELMGIDTYVPDSNESQLQRANERIQRSTPDSELNSLMSRALTGGNIKAEDIAVGERLIQYYSKTGDKAKLQDAIQATAMAGTSAGQTVQALSLLNHQTPEGQAIWLQRSVDKMNNELKKNRGENAEQFNLTQDMVDKIVNSQNTEELNNNLNDVYKELGQQVSKSNLQKLDAWRYFAMLANPKTHIRNMVGNAAMSGVQGVKNKVAGAIEGVVGQLNPNMERTHTIMPAIKEIRTFAKNDIKNVADRLGLNENKYNPKTRLENSMRTFKNNALENTLGKLFDLNDNLLEAEDGWGLKAGYTKALSEYMTANKLNPDTITDKQLAKARNYAVDQAQEATFHQASAIATAVNQFSNKNKLTKFVMDSTLPFKKTPINVAKAGLEYSPVGLAKSLIYDTVKLRKGDITVNKYIDNISKGLTGMGIAVLGYALADAGILKASGSDDEDKEKYDEEMGKQTYSIAIAGNTYSLDWLAPTGIPLFVGAECYEIMQTENEEKTSSSDEDSTYNQAIQSATNILDSFTNAMNPMTEMSMLSGLTSALKSYDQGSSQMLASLGTNAVKSYVNQFVPTAMSQIARTTDEYERNTTSTKTGVLPRAIDTTKNQVMNKIPVLRQMLPTRTDIWGNEVKQADNVIQRGLENTVFPWTRKEISTSKVDIALTELYEEIGESSILPDTLNKKLTINGQDYRLTNEEYSKYKTAYGETSYKLLNSLVSSNEYKNMTTKQKQVAIENIYDYAKEQNKVDYANSIGEEIETSTTYKVLKALEKGGGNQSQYLSFVGKTKDIQGEKSTQRKNKVLLDSNYSSTTKSIIYANTTGKDDSLYNILNNGNININEYLDYKIRDSKDEFSADKNSDGETISGSSKKKVYNYVNNNITGVGNRLIILGNQYKLQDNEKYALTEYINTIYRKTEDRLEVYKRLTKNYTVKNGEVYYK